MRIWLLMVCVFCAPYAQAQDVLRLGIFGVVEKADPLIIAGIEIDVPSGVSVLSPLGQGQQMMSGDTVAVVAALQEGRLTASRILEIYPVVGPVQKVADGTATIMGSAVHVPTDASVKPGQWFAFSGLWSGAKVITTRLRKIENSGYAQLVGLPVKPIADEPLKLGSSHLTGAQVTTDDLGADVWMLGGVPEDKGLAVRLMVRGVFGGDVDLALWQGHASGPVASQTFMIHGTMILGTAADALMPDVGELVARCVQYGRVVETASSDYIEPAFEALGCVRHIPAD